MKLVFRVKQSDEDTSYRYYYLLCDNGYLLPIKPSFKEDYSKMRMLATPYDN